MTNVENGALQTAIDNAAVGEVIVLTDNIALTKRVTVSNVVTLDLNGYIITGNIDDGYGAIYVGTKGALTVIDSSSKQTGDIINTVGNAIGNYGEVVIYAGSFTGNYALYNFYYSNTIYGKSTIYGGVFKSVDETSPSIANCGDLTINGGTIESVDTTNVLTITDGIVKNLYIGVADYNPANQSTCINGGSIFAFAVADDSSNSIAISGGTFNVAIDSKYLASGAKLAYDENTGSYGVTISHGLKVIATLSSRIKDLVIKDGQLIFIQDLGRIAFDFKGQRVFYNQIIELETEAERITLDSPLPGYYFVIGSAVLWLYQDNEWIQVTGRPDEFVFIGVELPALGQAKENMLYVNKANRDISVYDSVSDSYLVVSDYTNEATNQDIEELFS